METHTTSHDKGMIAEDLLAILCCPETKQDIRLLEPTVVEQLNQRIEKENSRQKGGNLSPKKLMEAFFGRMRPWSTPFEIKFR